MANWKARFVQEPYRDGYKLFVSREVSNHRREVLCSDVTIHIIDEFELAPNNAGFYLPDGAYQAIVEAIDPPNHRNEMNRLEEALTVERTRVDSILKRAIIR